MAIPTYIIKHETDDGFCSTLEEPIPASSILKIVEGIITNTNITKISINKVTSKYLDTLTLKWFVDTLTDDVSGLVYMDAIFREEDTNIWPFQLLSEEDIPEEYAGEDISAVGHWLWKKILTQEQKNHLGQLRTLG